MIVRGISQMCPQLRGESLYSEPDRVVHPIWKAASERTVRSVDANRTGRGPGGLVVHARRAFDDRQNLR